MICSLILFYNVRQNEKKKIICQLHRLFLLPFSSPFFPTIFFNFFPENLNALNLIKYVCTHATLYSHNLMKSENINNLQWWVSFSSRG